MQDKDLTGGNLYDAPNNNYQKFFDKFKEIESLSVSQWKPVHLIGYFAKKYKEQYHTPFKFKFNSPAPSKCFEVFQIKKLAQNLSSNPEILKKYIDWVFETKVILAKRRLTSISFLTTENVVTEYKINVLFGEKNNAGSFDRTTKLPDNYVSALSEAGLSSIKTYGDLAFLSKMDGMPIEFVNAFSKLETLGLEKNILEKIV